MSPCYTERVLLALFSSRLDLRIAFPIENTNGQNFYHPLILSVTSEIP